MPASPVELLIFSILDLLKGAIPAAIVVFIGALIGRELRKKIGKATKWNWLASALATTFIILWLLVLALYFYPLLTALQESNVGEVPSIFAPSPSSLLVSYLYGLFKVTLSAAVISLLLLPLELAGLYIFESVSKKLPKMPGWANLAIACYLTSAVSSAIIIFLVPESISGIFFFIFHG